MATIDRSLIELKEWFEKEKNENNLNDIKFFPFVDVSTTRNSFAHSIMEVIKAHESGRTQELRNF